MSGLKNVNIVITGASRGLGAQAAIAFSNQDAKLALIARTKNDLEDIRKKCKNLSNHITIAADLTQTEEVVKAINQSKKFLKSIDCVLHVAGGGLGKRDPLIDLEDLVLLFKLNVGAAVQINRMVLPEMISRKEGNIVHVGSIAGKEAVASVGYNTVKAALNMYVRSLGREMAAHGIIVTGINPGGFLAPGNSMRRLEKNNIEAFNRFIRQRMPRKKFGDALELIPMLEFLCSKKASMMCGCMIPIDGGEGTTA